MTHIYELGWPKADPTQRQWEEQPGHRVIELGVEVIEHLADSLDVVQLGAADAEVSAVWIDPEIESTERQGFNTPAAHRSRAPSARSGGA